MIKSSNSSTTKVIWKRTLCAFLLLSIECCQCARILGILPIRSKSHYSITRRIMTTLASRGHQVTVITGMEEKQAIVNYTHIQFTNIVYDIVDTANAERDDMNDILLLIKAFNWMESTDCRSLFQSDHLKQIVSSKQKLYDLIFIEVYHIPCYLALAAHLKVPVIWLAAVSSHYPIDYFTGNPNNPVYIPAITSGVTSEMSFTQRLWNTYLTAVIHFCQTNLFIPKAVTTFNEQFNTKVTVDQILQLPNLAFVYGHFTLLPRPNLPNVVEIGGLHIEEEKSLPQEISDFIENAHHGVIFFSFGTTVKCSSISEQKIEMFKDVFSKLPQRVIWRCNKADQIKVSDNVMIRYWLPQRDILAHKNVLAFISHGGLLGTYEAIYTATPVVGIPIFYDQQNDIRLLENYGAAIYLNYKHLTTNLLRESINEVVNNSRYKRSMEKLSTILKDQPISQLDTAIYWIEYIVRYNGAPHLRSSSASMPLYQYLLLDVIGFLIAFVLLILYIIIFVISKLFSVIRRWNFVNNLKNKLS